MYVCVRVLSCGVCGDALHRASTLSGSPASKLREG